MKKFLIAGLLIIGLFSFKFNISYAGQIINNNSANVNSGSNVTINITSNSKISSYNIKVNTSSLNGFQITSAESTEGTVSADNVTINGIKVAGTTNLGSFTFKAPTVTKDTTYTISFKASNLVLTSNYTDNGVEDTFTATITVKAPATNSTPANTTPEQPTTPTNPSANLSSDNTLKSLSVTGYTLSPAFAKDKTSYTITVPANVEKVTVSASTNNSKASKTISGNTGLKEGTNKVTVTVTAENGAKKTYEIKVIKLAQEVVTNPNVDENPNDVKLLLSMLNIEGVTLNPEFNPEILEYKAEVFEDISKLEIIATANKQDAIIEILGNEDLKYGENIIKIVVKSKDNKETIEYKIIINKNNEESTVVLSTNVDSTPKPNTIDFTKHKIFTFVLMGGVITLTIIATYTLSLERTYVGSKTKYVSKRLKN